MAIFHSYVKLPEGRMIHKIPRQFWMIQGNQIKSNCLRDDGFDPWIITPKKNLLNREKTWNHHAEHSLYISYVQYALYITISDSQNPHVLSVKYQPFQPLKLLAPSAGSRSTNSPSYTTPAVAATSSWELIYQRIQVINFNWDWFSLVYGWVYII